MPTPITSDFVEWFHQQIKQEMGVQPELGDRMTISFESNVIRFTVHYANGETATKELPGTEQECADIAAYYKKAAGQIQ